MSKVEKQRELTPEEKAAEVERLADIEKRLEKLPDGRIKVHLREPATSEDGTALTFLTVRPATARDIRQARKAIRDGEEQYFAFADALCDPKDSDGNPLYLGIRNNDDLELVQEAVDRSLGKFFPTGSNSSGA